MNPSRDDIRTVRALPVLFALALGSAATAALGGWPGEPEAVARSARTPPRAAGMRGWAWAREVSAVPNLVLHGVWGSGPKDVFAVGSGGTILHYDGRAWKVMPLGPYANDSTRETLYGVWGSGPKDVFAVGMNWTIMQYDGQHWSKWNSANVPSSVSSVWGSGPKDVFAVGWRGAILHYDGQALKRMTSGTAQDLWAVWGSGPKDVFAVGSNGTILHYDGRAWKPLTSGTAQHLSAVWGSGPRDVFALAGRTVVRYDGQAWKRMTSGASLRILKLWGNGPKDVFVLDDSGTIRHLDGQAWKPMAAGRPLPSDGRSVKAIWGSGPTDAFAVGENGMLLHLGRSPPSGPAPLQCGEDQVSKGGRCVCEVGQGIAGRCMQIFGDFMGWDPSGYYAKWTRDTTEGGTRPGNVVDKIVDLRTGASYDIDGQMSGGDLLKWQHVRFSKISSPAPKGWHPAMQRTGKTVVFSLQRGPTILTLGQEESLDAGAKLKQVSWGPNARSVFFEVIARGYSETYPFLVPKEVREPPRPAPGAAAGRPAPR